jgi:TetR/AcrR family transcriptional regulator, transcriptional repressor for nem operon
MTIAMLIIDDARHQLCQVAIYASEGGSMRVSKEKAAKNRQQILTAAARLFRERGVGATGVDAIAEDAGLTHGAVYSQFGSKDAIATEAIRLALERAAYLWQRIANRKGSEHAFPAIVDQYLSRKHRDDPGQGCVLATLGSEIARQSEDLRDTLTRELTQSLEFLAELLPSEDRSRSYENAIVAFSAMAGALMIARAVNDAALSDRILKATAKRLIDCARRK